MFSRAESLNKVEPLQKRALLPKSGKVNMKASKLRSLCAEIYKIIKSINPSFMI